MRRYRAVASAGPQVLRQLSLAQTDPCPTHR